MEVPLAWWANATRQILVLGRQAPRKFSYPKRHDLSFSLFFFPLFTHARFYLSFLFFFSCRFFRLMLSVARRHFAPSCGKIRGQGHLEKGRKMYRKKNPTSFDQKLNLEKLFSISYFSKYII